MISSETIYNAIAEGIGWDEAGRILGVGSAAQNFRVLERWRLRDAFANLVYQSPQARLALMKYPPPDAVINPLSDGYIQYETEVAVKDAMLVDDLIEAHASNARDVLDFGCGTGRLLRFLAQFAPQRRYSGCDVVEGAISHLRDSGMPGVFAVMPSAPPAPFAENSFDVVFAWSIFTHYSEPMHHLWLRDIHRMLRPGGVLLATVHSASSFATLRADPRVEGRLNFDALETAYNDTGFGYSPFYQAGATEGVDTANFGQAFISADYIRAHWAALYDITTIVTAVPGWQDMVILRRRG